MPTIVYRAIRGRQKFSEAPKVIKELGVVLDKEAKPMLIRQFDAVVANWKGKPVFKARKFIRPDKMWIDVFPTGEHADTWKYVSRGTKGPYPIPKTPKASGTLAFMWGGKGSYKPKTSPGGRYGGPGTVAGGSMIFPKQVMHPGIDAREFEEDIAKTQEPEFNRIMENAWKRIIRGL